MSKLITIETIQDRSFRRGEQVIAGQVLDGCHAEITPGQSIRIYGSHANHVDGPQAFDRTFKLGDSCEYDSYNLKYTGEIVSIGAKTITVEDHGSKRRLTIYQFAWRNWDFDAAAIAAHNSNELLYI